MQVEAICQREKAPFFAYDLDGLSAHLATIAAPGVRLWYATKANPLSSILKEMRSANFSFDVASAGELRQVLRQQASANDILLTGPAKTEAFLREALEAGVSVFVLESHRQAELLHQLVCEYDLHVDVLLRLQLEWSSAESSVLGGNAVTAFGMDWENWKSFSIDSYPRFRILGFHVFQWGNMQNPENLVQIWNRICEDAQNYGKTLGIESLPVVDLGGGLGIPYSSLGVSFPWSSVQDELTNLRERYSIQEIWLEIGRYAVGAFGKYCAPVVDKKTVRGKKLLVIDGGMNHLIRPSLVGEPFPIDVVGDKSGEKIDFQIHGPLCTALDKFGTIALPSDVAIGDWLVMHQCGAYGFTESMPYFLCHDQPAEYVFKNREWRCIRERSPSEAWLR